MTENNKKSTYSYEEILKCSKGELFPGGPKLPLPPMLMVHEIVNISEQGGTYGKGIIEAIYKITKEDWFFSCHFFNDNVMPGCLGIDAMWQLTGFYLGWLGDKGKGRALGSGNIKFTGEILPENNLVKYEMSIKKIIRKGKASVACTEGVTYIDGQKVYVAENLKVGVFID